MDTKLLLDLIIDSAPGDEQGIAHVINKLGYTIQQDDEACALMSKISVYIDANGASLIARLFLETHSRSVV